MSVSAQMIHTFFQLYCDCWCSSW